MSEFVFTSRYPGKSFRWASRDSMSVSFIAKKCLQFVNVMHSILLESVLTNLFLRGPHKNSSLSLIIKNSTKVSVRVYVKVYR